MMNAYSADQNETQDNRKPKQGEKVTFQIFSDKPKEKQSNKNRTNGKAKDYPVLEYATFLIPPLQFGGAACDGRGKGLQIKLFVDGQKNHRNGKGNPEQAHSRESDGNFGLNRKTQCCGQGITDDRDPSHKMRVTDFGLPAEKGAIVDLAEVRRTE